MRSRGSDDNGIDFSDGLFEAIEVFVDDDDVMFWMGIVKVEPIEKNIPLIIASRCLKLTNSQS